MLNDTDGSAVLRPPGHVLMMMMRAAVADSGDAGPWLTLTRARAVRPGEPGAYRHHVNLIDAPPLSPYRLVLLTGDEIMSHALEHSWESITAPTRGQLWELAALVVERMDAVGWVADYPAWLRAYESKTRTYEREARADKSAGDARAMRWLLAEQWLRAR